MVVTVVWCLGVAVVAAMLNSRPVKSQCTAKHCYDDEEMSVMKMLLRIQGSMEEHHISSVKEELSLKEELSSMKKELSLTKEVMLNVLTACSECYIIL